MKATNRRNNRSSSKCRPGPITRNPFLNFCREYRTKNKCQPAIQQIREAAKAWHKLSPQERTKYIVEAFYARKILRKKSSGRRGSRRNSAARRRRNARVTKRRR